MNGLLLNNLSLHKKEEILSPWLMIDSCVIAMHTSWYVVMPTTGIEPLVASYSMVMGNQIPYDP